MPPLPNNPQLSRRDSNYVYPKSPWDQKEELLQQQGGPAIGQTVPNGELPIISPINRGLQAMADVVDIPGKIMGAYNTAKNLISPPIYAGEPTQDIATQWMTKRFGNYSRR